jgi:hypothetical protein
MDSWRGVMWMLYRIECGDETCDMFDEHGFHNMRTTRARAASWFRSQGWKLKRGKWYCPHHAS